MFSNRAKDLLNNINKLPNEIVSIIEGYVPAIVKVFWNKTMYEANHKLIIQLLLKQKKTLKNIFGQ